jgi:hypothetical protein
MSFQWVLVPVLLAILLLTSINHEHGTLLFVFIFPLINSLPYFFGIFEHIPHAPTALVVFLLYFLGWCIHFGFSPEKLSFDNPILKPMTLFALLVLISGVFNYLRFTNFYPFVSDRVYELVTNVDGVTTGGAIMSTFLHSFNYLTGFIFLFILLNTIRSKEFAKRLLTVLLFSLAVSLMVGFYQILRDPSFGNTPFWVKMGQINATFKGANSFGSFLAVMVPVVLGSIFAAKGSRKALFVVFLLSILFLFPHIGARSAFLGLGVSLSAFILLTIKIIPFHKFSEWKFWKNSGARVAALLVLIVVLIGGAVSFTQSRLYDRLKSNINDLKTTGNWVKISPERYFLWREAYSMMKGFPVTGVGVGGYIVELPNYYLLDEEDNEFALDSFKRIDSAENYFLHVGAEMGIIGFILVGWMFFALFRQLNVNHKKLFRGEKDNYLFLGASAGLIALFSNYFFHSFIGNFETKYTFWLLGGIVVVWGGMQDKSPDKKEKGGRFKILSVCCIFLFSGIHIWNCTHSLSLKSRTKMFGLKQNFGLYGVEVTDEGKKFQWTREYGGLTLEVDKPVLRIPLHASHPDIKENPVKVEIYLVKDFFKEKTLLDEIVLSDNAWGTHEFPIPQELGNEVILLIHVSRTWSPQKELGVPDSRRLGVAVGEIVLEDDGGKNTLAVRL